MVKAYKNRVFYNYSLRSIANKIGVTKETVRKHLPTLFKLKLITKQGSHLSIIGINKIKGKSHCVLVPCFTNKTKQITALRWALIKKSFDRQAEAISHKSKIVTYANTNLKPTKKQLKYIAKNGGLTKVVNKIRKDGNQCLTLSNKSFGKLINRSKQTGQRLQKQFNQLAFIKSTYRFVTIKENAHIVDYIENYYGQGYIYTSDNRIVKQKSNAIAMQM